jgi:F-type H+-transporting ATPase subunit a
MMQQPKVDIGEIVLHHASDSYEIGFDGVFNNRFVWHWQKWPDIHLGRLTVNLTPTKHTIFMLLAAVLVFVTMRLAGRALARQQAGERAPKGFAAGIEGLVLWVRNDIAIENIGPNGAKFAPLILTLFFFILYMNVLGLFPWGASPTANIGVTAALAIVVFFVVEISGFIKLGPRGYLKTIFIDLPGLPGPAGAVMSVLMAPIELIGKFTKPFALAVRLFGTLVAGHFVILSLFGIVLLFGYLAYWNWMIGVTTAALVLSIMLLELFVAGLQAYVFALLSATFIGLMQSEHH